MQLKSLYIKDYKILKDFTIDFAYDFERYISVFIGANGSGKSTVLEAIAQIFSNAYLNEKAKFGFELEYSVKFEEKIEETSTTSEFHTDYVLVKLAANKGEQININVDSAIDDTDLTEKLNEKTKQIILGKKKYSLLPDNVVVYYSGLSEIMQELVVPHNELISTSYRKNNTLTERDFFYFKPEHFGVFLTSLLSFEYGNIPEFLKSKAKIGGVQSIQIRLKKPDWANDKIENFWGAKGEVRNFLDYINENSASVEDLHNPDKLKGVGNIVIEALQDEVLIITIISQQKLFEIRGHLIDERSLFEILNIMLIDGLLKDIKFSFQQEGNNKPNFGILSEGEQQSIIIKGLTELLVEKNTLFLFDEPDTYLHPKWQRQFISEIENSIEQNANNEISYLIATHSPQILSNANPEKTFVKIIEEGQLIENTPKYYGREISSILYNLMGVEERNKAIRNDLSKLFILIEDEDIKEAETELQRLVEILGESDPDIKNATIQLEYLKEDEADN